MVIIERNDDGTFTAVPQHNQKVGFIGMGKTVEETMSDLRNSYSEAKEMLPTLPEMSFEYKFDTASLRICRPSRASTVTSSAITPREKVAQRPKPFSASKMASADLRIR